MKTFIAILAYALSLFGIDVGSHTRIDRVTSNGADVLYSRVVAQPGGTRFECLRSASGQCYYTVYPRDCGPVQGRIGQPAVACALQPERFALEGGGSRQVSGSPGSRLCVSAQATSTARDCD